MAIGTILIGKRLKGTCGGLGSIMGEDCMFCSKAEECKKKKEQEKLLAEG
ncbi:MAG: (Na+)-NQR maturation NqrM [Bacteriovoracaceae bacterium]|nr:(Na+)-NQR maturation NqrM [Bacteriovoracaceae bacterium]